MPYSADMPDQLPRHSIDLPRSLAADLRRYAGEAGVPISALVYKWLTVGAYIAAHFPEIRLPPADRAPRGSLGDTSTVKWSQGTEEYERCAAALEAAGSSPTALIRGMAERYVAVGGDPLAMEWLPKRASQTKRARQSKGVSRAA